MSLSVRHFLVRIGSKGCLITVGLKSMSKLMQASLNLVRICHHYLH